MFDIRKDGIVNDQGTKFYFTMEMGAELDDDPQPDDPWVVLAPSGSEKYNKELLKKVAHPKYKRLARKKNSETDPAWIELQCELASECILLDWGNFAMDGVSVPYSAETAKQWLIEFPYFRRRVSQMADAMWDFMNQIDDETEENLEQPSTASSAAPSVDQS